MIGNRDAQFKGSDFRGNFKQIIAKRSDLKRTQEVRLTPAGSGLFVVYHAGQVLGKITATGLYAAYDDGASDGTQVAKGILEATTEVDDQAGGTLAIMLRSATVFEDLLVGLDAAGKVDLGSKSYVENGVNLLDF